MLRRPLATRSPATAVAVAEILRAPVVVSQREGDDPVRVVRMEFHAQSAGGFGTILASRASRLAGSLCLRGMARNSNRR